MFLCSDLVLYFLYFLWISLSMVYCYIIVVYSWPWSLTYLPLEQISNGKVIWNQSQGLSPSRTVTVSSLTHCSDALEWKGTFLRLRCDGKFREVALRGEKPQHRTGWVISWERVKVFCGNNSHLRVCTQMTDLETEFMSSETRPFGDTKEVTA